MPALKEKVKFFCPVRTVITFMDIKGAYRDSQELFFIFKDRTPVKPYNLRFLLRELLGRLNLDASLYYVHSFRGGRTVDLEKFGYSLEQIKAMGRWKSNAVYRYLKRYIIRLGYSVLSECRSTGLTLLKNVCLKW